MVEKSYFHNGFTVGDAVEAPYCAELTAQLRELLYSSSGGYVLPDIDDMLEVTAGAGRTVDVATGAALVFGNYYINDAIKNLALTENTSPYPRIDRVVLKLDWTAQTIRLVIRNGAPKALPEPPALTATEMSLAMIWQPAGYAASADTYIYDERNFVHNPLHQNRYSTENLMHNSEFVVFSGENVSGAVAPDGWELNTVGPPPNSYTIHSATKFDSMRRGRSIILTGDGTGVEANVHTHENSTKPFTLKMLVHVLAGSYEISFGATTKTLGSTIDPVELIIRGDFTSFVTLDIEPLDSDCEMQLGTVTLAYGYIPAVLSNPGEFDEVILFDHLCLCRDDAYNGTNAHGDSTDTVNSNLWGYSEEFPAIMGDAKAILVELSSWDSSSGAVITEAVVHIKTNGVIVLSSYVSRLPDNKARVGVGAIQAVPDGAGNYEFDVQFVAAGVTSSYASISFIGVVI